jgi:hypothetical protein
MAKVNKNYGICTICMDDILDNNDKFTTKCNHTFHKSCFDTYHKANPANILKCPNCHTTLNIPVFDNEKIEEEEIDEYIENWRDELRDNPRKFNCNDIIKQIKLTYKDKFTIDDKLIKNICENRLRVEGLNGGKKQLNTTIKQQKKTIKRNHKRSKKTIKRKYKNRHLKYKRF